jgi:hypothetical protein
MNTAERREGIPMNAAEHLDGAARRPVLGLHLAGLIAVPICLAAGGLELARALGGHQLSWAYAIEWPLIGGFVVYVWIRLVRERRSPTAGQTPRPAIDNTDHTGPADDAGLRAWQAYLVQLHANDPPGGPPRRPVHTPGDDTSRG